MSNHRDAASARAIGERWERNFCVLAADHGKVFSPHQIDRPDKSASAWGPRENGKYSRYLLPDVTIWSAPGEHHEIKHKNQTPDGCYGLERYRLNALVCWANTTGQQVLYTIHDWEKAGARGADENVPNRIEHWYFADVEDISRRHTKVTQRGTSLVNGMLKNDVEIVYWTARRYFHPLAELWTAAAPPSIQRGA